MADGIPGLLRVIFNFRCALVPQLLLATTRNVSLTGKLALYWMVTELVFCPEVITEPAHGVHVYEVAPDTALTKYVLLSPGHTFAIPPAVVIDPGSAGMVFTINAAPGDVLLQPALVTLTE